jgi:hypothetical protein
MATTPCDNVQIKYKGDGKQTLFTFPFTYLHQGDINVSLWDDTTKNYVVLPRDKWIFANATTVQLQDPPQVPPPKQHPSDPDVFNLKISRLTDIVRAESEFYPGSAIRAEDLNDNFEQLRFAIQEGRCEVNGQISLLLEDKVWTKFRIGQLGGATIYEQDQKEGKWTRNLSDKYLATSDAIAARLDPYVQDAVPAPLALPGKEQQGKSWFDTQDLVHRFWDEDAGSWVTLANTGPVGPQGQKGDTGTYATIVQELPPTARVDGTPIRPGDSWFRTSNAQLYAWYDDGTSKQWVSISKTGPKGDKGDQGNIGLTGATGPQGPTGATGATGPKGDTGTIGVTGPTGPAGPAGTTGAKGDKGDTGAAAGFGAPTISMLAPSATPTVAASGPDTAKVFAFGVPKGDPTRVTSAGTPPASPVAGDLWFNTTNGQLYCWYDDGSSKQWVSISKTGPAAAIATAATVGTVKPGTNLTVTADGTLNAQVPGAITYQGTTDATAAPPATPVIDGLYINTKAGTVNAGFTGITGTVAVGDWFLWDGTSWDHVGAGAATGVSSVSVTAPITKTGTATAPTIGIAAATTTAPGSLSAADKVKLDGLVAGTTNPVMDGTAAVGTATTWTRSDHVHPTDTSRAPEAPDGSVDGTVQFIRQVVTAGTTNTKSWTKLPTFGATVSATPPASPVSGQLWFNSNKGILYTYYQDGSSNQWVSVMGSKAR